MHSGANVPFESNAARSFLTFNQTMFEGGELVLRMLRKQANAEHKLAGYVLASTYAHLPTRMNIYRVQRLLDTPTFIPHRLSREQLDVSEYETANDTAEVHAFFADNKTSIVTLRSDRFVWSNESAPRQLFVTCVFFENGEYSVTQEYLSSSLDALLGGLIALFVFAVCLPCCVLYALAACMSCCCRGKGQKKSPLSMLQSLSSSGQKDDRDNNDDCNCMEFVDKSFILGSCFVTFGSIIVTMLSLVSVVFNVVLIANGLAYANVLLADVRQLSLRLLADYSVNIGGLVDVLDTFTSFIASWHEAVASECAGGRLVLGMAILALVFWFLVLSLSLDVFVRVKVLVTRSSGPFLEMIGNSVSRLLLLLLQSALQQVYFVLIDFRAADNNNDGIEPVGCTALDDSLLSLQPVRSVFWVMTAGIAVFLLIMPAIGGGKSSIYAEHIGHYAIILLLGVGVNLLVVFGVWTKYVLKWTNVVQRSQARRGSDDQRGDAYAGTMDTIGRVAGLAWMLLPPYFAIVTKLAEASSDAPLVVAEPIGPELDPRPVRMFVAALNYTSLAFQVHAAATASATSLVAAAAIVASRDLIVKLVIKIVKLWRHLHRPEAVRETKNVELANVEMKREVEEEVEKEEEEEEQEEQEQEQKQEEEGDDEDDARHDDNVNNEEPPEEEETTTSEDLIE